MKTLLGFLICLLSAQTLSAFDKPLKVFILAGQSNMQGHAKVSTLDYLADDEATVPLLNEIRSADGNLKECEQVWISSVGCAGDGWSEVIEQTGKLKAGFGASPEKIGPELTFGIRMAQSLKQPILIIKTSWGGRSLMTDFRPPSAGDRKFDDFIRSKWRERGLDPDAEATRHNKELNGVFYRHMIDHVKRVLSDIKRVVPSYDPEQGYELAGFVWFQGFNDLVDSWTYPQRMQPGGYDAYADLLAHLIRDVRRDLATPRLPFVVGVMGIGGEQEGSKPPQLHFRQAQASVAELPEFRGNVVAVQTSPFWSDELAAIDAKHEAVNQMRYFLNQKHKDHANADGRMTDEQKQAYLKDYESKLISPEKAAFWNRGASNAAYHYLGCAKTFALIGQAFAEANLKLISGSQTP